MIDTSKLIPQRKGEARLSGKTITTIGLVKKDVIKIDSLLKEKLVLSKVRYSILRRQNETDKRSRREDILENKKSRQQDYDVKSNDKRKGVGGAAVQQALLKLIEGTEIEMERMQGLSKIRFVVDTSNILFIVGGAFTGLDEIIQKRLGEDKRSIGFGANFKEAESLVNIFNKVQPEDLEEYGFIPEILGRIPTIAPLQELTKENLIDILTKVKNNLMDQYGRLFAYSGLELKISKKGLEYIAEKAIERKVGARGLKSLIEMVLLDYMFNLESAVLDEKDVKKIIDEVQT